MPGIIMFHRSPKFLAIACTAFVLSVPAFAQYAWVDEKGIRQYSDQPPPAFIPQSRILKEPGAPKGARPASGRFPTSTSTTSSPAAEAPTAAVGPMTSAERNADFNKRRIEQAEKERKAADQEKLADERKQNCERTREYQRGLENGVRLVRTDKDGERSVLTDEQRAREIKETKQMLEDCK